MPEYLFQGTVTLSGVDFFVSADDEDEAKAKAQSGEYDSYKTDMASAVDWALTLTTLKLNE